MKVNIKIMLILLIRVITASNIYAFEQGSHGNWRGESTVSIYCDYTEVDYELDKFAVLIAKTELCKEAACVYSEEWNIPESDVASLLFSLIDSEIQKIGGNYPQKRIDFTILLTLDSYMVSAAEMQFRFDLENRLLYTLPWAKIDEIYVKAAKYRQYADVFMSVDEARTICRSAGNIINYYDLCGYLVEDTYDMLELYSSMNILLADQFPEFYFFDGVINLSNGNYQDADEDFEYFLEYYPKNIPAYLYRAILAGQLGTGRAEKYLNIADRLNPEDEISIILTANVNKLLMLNEKAKSYYEKALQKYPSNYMPYMFLGEFVYNEGNIQKALNLFQKAYDVGGSQSYHAEALKNLISNLKSDL